MNSNVLRCEIWKELQNKENEIGKSYFKAKLEKTLDIAITPNRADCLGVRGIARDLASSGLGSLLKLKKKTLKQTLKQPIKVSILKEKNHGCLSFGSCYIKNITNKESPSNAAMDITIAPAGQLAARELSGPWLWFNLLTKSLNIDFDNLFIDTKHEETINAK